MKTCKTLLAMCLLLALVAACGGRKEEEAPAPAAPSGGGSAAAFDPSTGTASVTGKVSLDGTPQPPAQIKMNADATCMSLHKEPVYSEEVLVADGKLQNTFVYVKEGLEKYTFTPPAEPAAIDQQGCHYTPHVSGMMVNQKLKIINSDPTLHNIHCWAEKNPQFNVGQPVKGMTTEKNTFTTPEVMVRFKCDVHKWMASYVGVLPHPYYSVSGKDGAFSLAKLPPGDYVIEAWHEKYGTQTQKVTLGDKDAKEINFTFKAS